MKKLCVVQEGKVINVGPWQYEFKERDKETGEVTVIDNPLPDGAVVGEFEIEWTADGRIVLATDYAALRRAEYPPIAEQLDSLWKGGQEADSMRERVSEVKRRHPK